MDTRRKLSRVLQFDQSYGTLKRTRPLLPRIFFFRTGRKSLAWAQTASRARALQKCKPRTDRERCTPKITGNLGIRWAHTPCVTKTRIVKRQRLTGFWKVPSFRRIEKSSNFSGRRDRECTRVCTTRKRQSGGNRFQ